MLTFLWPGGTPTQTFWLCQASQDSISSGGHRTSFINGRGLLPPAATKWSHHACQHDSVFSPCKRKAAAASNLKKYSLQYTALSYSQHAPKGITIISEQPLCENFIIGNHICHGTQSEQCRVKHSGLPPGSGQNDTSRWPSAQPKPSNTTQWT